MIINPYKSVDWSTFQRIGSVTHAHAKTQEQFDCLYAGGIRHMAISNYYRSEPFYPVIEEKVSGIESADTVIFPNDCIPCPNAEHHNMTVNALHMCTVGATFSSGSPEVINPDGTSDRSAKPSGMGGRDWRTLIKLTIPTLLFNDGGGLTINHPTWSNLSMDNIFDILDYSPYVLGIEAFNTDAVHDEEYWDNVLITGRRAWGFFVPDHKHKTKPNGDWLGRNILLVSELSEHECLKAYREGRFYGSMRGSNLTFTNIELNDSVISVSTNDAESIDVVEDGIVTTYSSDSCEHSFAPDATYVRIKAYKNGDTIFSNPFIFKPYVPKRRKMMNYYDEYQINAMLWF